MLRALPTPLELALQRVSAPPQPMLLLARLQLTVLQLATALTPKLSRARLLNLQPAQLLLAHAQLVGLLARCQALLRPPVVYLLAICLLADPQVLQLLPRHPRLQPLAHPPSLRLLWCSPFVSLLARSPVLHSQLTAPLLACQRPPRLACACHLPLVASPPQPAHLQQG